MKATWKLPAAAVALAALALTGVHASSHREAPLISSDPLADNTDVYAFVSPNAPDKVTLIANFIPFEAPYGGPTFFKFDDNVLYEILVDNNGDAVEDATFWVQRPHDRDRSADLDAHGQWRAARIGVRSECRDRCVVHCEPSVRDQPRATRIAEANPARAHRRASVTAHLWSSSSATPRSMTRRKPQSI